MRFPSHRGRIAAFAALFAAPAGALAQAPATETSIPPTIVTARPHMDGSLVVPTNEQEAERLRQIPGNVTLVPAQEWRERAGVVGIPDMLALVPGVFSGPKWGEDSRLAIRGSGIARNFHLRGVLLLQDGIPLNQADGSGDFQELDPLAILRTEVLRGGNAFYLGANTLGGALRFITPTGRTNPGLVLRGEAGSFGFIRGQAAYGTSSGAFDIWASQTGMYQDGFRDHSASRSWRFNANLGWQIADNAETRFYLSYNNIYQQIPGTVSRTQALTNPQAAFPTNVLLNYQRNIESLRIGNRTAWRPYEGLLLEAGFGFVDRQLDHPIFQYLDNHTQDAVLFLRGTADGEVFGLRNTLRFGANGVMGTNANNRYVNLAGRPGRLTYSSFDRASGGDVHAENSLFVLPNLAVVAGAQAGQSYRSSTDHFWQDGNQSGSARYGWVNPRFGLLWNATSTVQGFANLTWSTEVPTLSDLIPLVASAIGFNSLKPQRAMTLEVGTRGTAGNLAWEIAAFRSWINDEIQLFTVGQNQSFALNAQSTLHTGVEAALSWTFGRNSFAAGDRFVLRQAFTWGSHVFDNNPVWRDNQIPGIPSIIYQAELRYLHPAGAFLAPTLNWIPQAFYVDNANTLRTDAYALVGLRAGWDFANGISIFADGRNLGDVKNISSASVVPRAVPNQPLMEPGFGRAVYAGLQFRF